MTEATQTVRTAFAAAIEDLLIDRSPFTIKGHTFHVVCTGEHAPRFAPEGTAPWRVYAVRCDCGVEVSVGETKFPGAKIVDHLVWCGA